MGKLNQKLNQKFQPNLHFCRHSKGFETLSEIYPNGFRSGLFRRLWPKGLKCFRVNTTELFVVPQKVFVPLFSCIRSLDSCPGIVCSRVYRSVRCHRKTLSQRPRDIHKGWVPSPEGPLR